RAGPEAVAAIAAIYSQILDEHFARSFQAHDAGKTAFAEAIKRGEPRARAAVLAAFAHESKVAEAVSLLPLRNMDKDDFLAIPISRPGVQRADPESLWHRMRLAGIWVLCGPTSLGNSEVMLYRARVIGSDEQLVTPSNEFN